jgi:hypothetical protein
MRSAVLLLSTGLLILSASLNPPRAEDTYSPAENGAPLGDTRGGAGNMVETEGELHRNAFNKPCLAYQPYTRPYVVDTHIFDYVVGVTNSCPTAIRTRICQIDHSGCESAAVPAYHSMDVVMGLGPLSNEFHYVAKEMP